MSLIVPIVIVSLILGLSSDKVHPLGWMALLAVIIGTIAKYSISH